MRDMDAIKAHAENLQWTTAECLVYMRRLIARVEKLEKALRDIEAVGSPTSMLATAALYEEEDGE